MAQNDVFDLWLEAGIDGPVPLQGLLTPIEDIVLDIYVSSVANNYPGLLDPVVEEPVQAPVI